MEGCRTRGVKLVERKIRNNEGRMMAERGDVAGQMNKWRNKAELF